MAILWSIHRHEVATYFNPWQRRGIFNKHNNVRPERANKKKRHKMTNHFNPTAMPSII
ncbi:MAG: hypothetical protein U9R32_00840 [Bacteroidota bacterium]|nr:hypothetical protein [Bacteroidota bacterium]